MTSVIDKIHKLLERPARPLDEVVVPLDEASIDRLLCLLCDTRDDELTCDEVFGRLDEYVDCLLSHQQFAGPTPLVEHHLTLCPDCRNEYDALVQALRRAGADLE